MKKFIALVVLLCAVLVSSTALAADWVWIYSDEFVTIYVDNNSIRRDYNYSGYVFRAYTKMVYSEAGLEKLIEQYLKNNVPINTKKAKKILHSISLTYFKDDDGIKHGSIVLAAHYDKQENFIPEMSFSVDKPNWHIAPPDSMAEAVFDAIRVRVPN